MGNHSFLYRIIEDLLLKDSDLSKFNIVLPGKRPIVFIKRILEEKQYSGVLPNFYTIEDIISKLSEKQLIQGVALWLFAFEIYKNNFEEDFSNFLKWFPVLQKDWDDILKFADNEKKVLGYMFDEERIKNWGEGLGEPSETRKRNLDFWKKMNVFLPKLKKALGEKNLATSGMIHEEVRAKIESFAQQTDEKFVFCGFNALTPMEEKMIKKLLQWDKAICYFQADEYYMNDEKQEAGKFLRKYKNWKEFNDNRVFSWIDNRFSKGKNIQVFEVSGNVTQTKVLPSIFEELGNQNIDDTAVVLLDENLLPTSLSALDSIDNLNITMGFPLKNLAFSSAVKKIFTIQKQLEKKPNTYYYNDIFSVLESLPNNQENTIIIENFVKEVVGRNMVYLSSQRLQEYLENLSYFKIFIKPDSVQDYLELLINFCNQLKNNDIDDISYENISHFEKTFKIIKNQLSAYSFTINMETLEVLINQLINSETIDFKGEPLKGLQIMGLLETRLLNFKNIILLSVNEGKLPLGNSQNTYLPFDVRLNYNLHTFLENDSIYAYHFYRLIQDAQNVYLLYNALSSGVNTGEKSRFITQIEMESSHKIERKIIENPSEPVLEEPILIEKTPLVISELENWKKNIAPSHLVSYLYDPIQFYIQKVLKINEVEEVEEELSQKSYGNLVHYSLEFLYGDFKGKTLVVSDLENKLKEIDNAIDEAIRKLKHQPEFYERGMNYIQKSMAKRTIEQILGYDLDLVKSGKSLEIIDLERRIEDVEFVIDAENNNIVKFKGFIDRIDKLDGVTRIIDYKTGKASHLTLEFKDKTEKKLCDEKYKQALQLCIYQYYAERNPLFKGEIQSGIWSFSQVKTGVQFLSFKDGDLDTAMISIRNLILEILNPEIPFGGKIDNEEEE